MEVNEYEVNPNEFCPIFSSPRNPTEKLDIKSSLSFQRQCKKSMMGNVVPP